MFLNFTGEKAESLKSKYREIATSYKGQDLAFLVGDAESSQGAFQVTISLRLSQSFSPNVLHISKQFFVISCVGL